MEMSHNNVLVIVVIFDISFLWWLSKNIDIGDNESLLCILQTRFLMAYHINFKEILANTWWERYEILMLDGAIILLTSANN